MESIDIQRINLQYICVGVGCSNDKVRVGGAIRCYRRSRAPERRGRSAEFFLASAGENNKGRNVRHLDRQGVPTWRSLNAKRLRSASVRVRKDYGSQEVEQVVDLKENRGYAPT